MSNKIKRCILYGIVVIMLALFATDYILKHRSYYIIVTDAGSTSTRAHLYFIKQNIFTRKHNRQLNFVATRKVNTPIQSIFNKPKTTGQNTYFRKLFSFNNIELPATKHKLTEIYVLATGGVRELPHKQQENIVRLGTYFLKQNLKEMGFKYAKGHSKIEILTGKKEGLFAWLAVNYLKDAFKEPENLPIYGMLELGGASTQIAFITNESLKDEFVDFYFKHKPYKTYVHSYLTLGFNDVFEKFKQQENAAFCYPKEFPFAENKKGTGNFDECFNTLNTYLQNKSKLKQCNLIFGDSCTSMGIYLPKEKAQEFILLSGFYYTLNYLGLANKSTTLAELKTASEKICNTNWALLNPDLKLTKELKPRACFNATWVYTLLKAYGLENSQIKIFATNKINQHYSNWALGAAIYNLYGNNLH